jgi:putative transposase
VVRRPWLDVEQDFLSLYMQFVEGSFYHIYNRGNNKQLIFFQEKNYEFFLNKIQQYVVPHSHLLAWCLMPNHFHLLIQANQETQKIVKETPIKINALTEAFRLMLSSYTRAIQKQESMVGSLFQQKTKFKCVDDYLDSAFHYVHQNPYRAGLVKKMEEYPWSSMREYVKGSRQDQDRSRQDHSKWSDDYTQICRQDIAYQFMNIDKERFLIDSYSVVPDEVMRNIEAE